MCHAAEVQAARAAAGGLAGFNVAQFYMRAGDGERALDWLEKACEARDPGAPYLRISALWESLRDQPRYKELIERMNLRK